MSKGGCQSATTRIEIFVSELVVAGLQIDFELDLTVSYIVKSVTTHLFENCPRKAKWIWPSEADWVANQDLLPE